MTITRLFAVVGLALSLTACSSMYVEANQPMACLTLQPRTFPVSTSGGSGSFTQAVDLGLSDALPDFIISGSPQNHVLRFESLTISLLPPGPTSFAWLQSLRLQVKTAAGKTITLAGLTGATVTGNTVTLQPLPDNPSLFDFMQDGQLDFVVDGAIQNFPATSTSFTGTVTTCFSAQVKKTLQELIGG